MLVVTNDSPWDPYNGTFASQELAYQDYETNFVTSRKINKHEIFSF